MDIGLLQMTQRSVQPVKQPTVTSSTSNDNSFDKVFSEAVQTNTAEKEAAPVSENEQVAQVVEEVKEIAETETLEEALQVLDVEHDEAVVVVQIDGEMVMIDELMNMDDLAALLDMTAEDLQQIIAKLTGEPVEQLDVWAVLEQAPQLLAQITAVLQGENQIVTPEEAGQLAKFLQVAQLVGQKQDTVYKQEITLTDSKQALQQFTQQLTTLSNQQNGQQQSQQQSQPQQTFVQVMQQVQTASTQTTQVTNTTEAPEQVQAPVQQVTTQPAVKTVSVALPMERSAQSEALIKEIQNHINRMQMSNNNGVIKLTMRLFPENLGQIRVEVMQQDGVMQARILATSAAGKELLDSNLSNLKTSLVAQNIQLDRIDIAQSLQSSDAGRDQGLFNQFFRQQQQEVEEEDNENDEESISFDELLEEQLQAEEV